MNLVVPGGINAVGKMLANIGVSLTLARLVSWMVGQLTRSSGSSAKLEAGLAITIALILPFAWRRLEVSWALVEPSRGKNTPA